VVVKRYRVDPCSAKVTSKCLRIPVLIKKPDVGFAAVIPSAPIGGIQCAIRIEGHSTQKVVLRNRKNIGQSSVRLVSLNGSVVSGDEDISHGWRACWHKWRYRDGLRRRGIGARGIRPKDRRLNASSPVVDVGNGGRRGCREG